MSTDHDPTNSVLPTFLNSTCLNQTTPDWLREKAELLLRSICTIWAILRVFAALQTRTTSHSQPYGRVFEDDPQSTKRGL
jgi:hypothetical protein